MSWLLNLLQKLFKPKPPQPKAAEPVKESSVIDRREFDSPVGNQEMDGNGADNDCSSYACASALSQFVFFKMGTKTVFSPNTIWKLQKGAQNLTAALNACGKFPGQEGARDSQGVLYSLDRYEPRDVSEPISDFINRHLFCGHSIVMELKQSGPLNNGSWVIAPNAVYDSTHAVSVSALLPEGVVIKNSFGVGHGQNGFQLIPLSQLNRNVIALYALCRVSRV